MTARHNDIIELQVEGIAPGLRLRVHGGGDQMISARLREEHCWEPYETALTLQHLHPGDVYVDVGANIGYYTLVAAARVGAQGAVLAYEPEPGNFALLQANVAMNGLPQVQTFNLALYDQDADGKIYLSADNFGDHRVYGNDGGDEGAGARESRAITLVHGGRHVGQRVPRIDFLKIDTQGAEFFVLNGLHQLVLENRKHLRMVIEFCPWGIRQSGADGHELLRLLDATGMDYHIIDHQQECLIPAQSHHLAEWIDRMAQEPDNEGFINLLVVPAGYRVG